MSAHSVLAPSSAHRWVVCPGSVKLEQAYPETEEGEAAAEGTAAHHVGAEELLGREAPVGSVAPNGIIITEEMAEGAALWVEDVLTVTGIDNSQVMVEQRVSMPRIFSGLIKCVDCNGHGHNMFGHECEPCNGTGETETECFGTPDTWFYDQRNGHLYVWDFKFGHGVVEATENWQLIAYACGILDLLGIDGRNDQHLWVHLRVVQPRAHHRDGRVREWKVLASDLRGYFNRLHDAAHEALGPVAHTQSGPHCLHCKAAHACPTLQRATWSAADFIGGSAAEELNADAAAYEQGLLEHLEQLIKARKQGREADLQARLKRGEVVPGYCLEDTYGRTAWKPGDEAMVIMLGDMSGVDLRKPAAAITPKQAIALLDKNKVDSRVIHEYAHTPRTGVKLARDTNLLNRARAGFGVKLEQ